MPMRLQLVMLPLVILGMSCAGCSDDTSPTGGTDAAAPVATDAGTSSPDAGQPVVPADNPLLGTWAFDAPMAGSGVDGVAFYDDGSVAVFGRVAQCVAAELGRWRVEGEQLFIQMGEQPGQPQNYVVDGDRLEITPEGMEPMALSRQDPGCDKPAAVGDLRERVAATWRVEGQGDRGHILTGMNRYVRSDNVAECTQDAVGDWDIDGVGLLRIRIGDDETVYQVTSESEGVLEVRTADGTAERWIRAEENCERQPNEYNIVGTWTPSTPDQPNIALTVTGEWKALDNLESCGVTQTRRYILTKVPPEFVLIAESEQEEQLVYSFRAVDENRFAITREGVEITYARAEQNCHGEEQAQDLDYPIIGTWSSPDQGAPNFAFSAEGAGMTVQAVDNCAMTEIFSYRLADNPPRLEVMRDPEGVPNPNGQPQVDVYEFRPSGENAFAISRDGVTWRYTKTNGNCHNPGGGGGEPIDYPIVGTWEAEGQPGLALNRDQQGFYGQYITNINGCEAGEGFSYTLAGEPPVLTLLLNRDNQLVRVPHPFARIDDNSFTLTIDNRPVTYRRSQSNCHAAGQESELDYAIIGTWGTQVNGQPTLAFRRDNVGNLGQEISSLENCLVQASFSYRLIAEPPSLERLYTDQNGQIDERRQPFRAINANSFAVIINGQEVIYSRLESDCHTRNDGPPPPAEVNPQQLLGTWQAEGNAGYAFGANNAFKKLSNAANCTVELQGTYELVGTLLTLTPGDNQRPLFFSASMADENSLALTDDNQQRTALRRIERSCF